MPPVSTTDDEVTNAATDETDLTENPEAAFDDEFESAASAVVGDDEDVDEEEPTIAVDDDESLDEEEEPADGEPAAAEGVDRGDGRDTKGKFAPKPGDAKPDAQAAKPGEQPAATGQAAPAATTEQAGATTDTPKWESYTVRADRETVPLEGVQVSRKDGYAIIAMPEKQLGRFNERIARGHLAERFWQTLKQERAQFEFEKSAPPRQSDAEIEAALTLEMVKPHLADIFSQEQIDNLELRVELAKRKAADDYTKAEGERRTKADTDRAAAESAANEPMQALDWLRQEFMHVLGSPEYGMGAHNLTPEEVTQAFHELTPYIRSVIYRDGNDWYSERDLIVNKLRQKAAARSAAPARAGDTAAPAPSAKPDAATRAERFNKGQATAASPAGQPKSTSVKAQRTTNGKRPQAGTATDRNTRQPPRVSPAQRAEDNWVNTRKNFMRSDSLDFDEIEDDG